MGSVELQVALPHTYMRRERECGKGWDGGEVDAVE